MDAKKRKYGSTYLQGWVLQIHKWEIIDDRPLHTNLKIIAFQIRPDLLKNSQIIQVEKKDNPISSQKNSCEIKNGFYLVFPTFVLKGDL